MSFVPVNPRPMLQDLVDKTVLVRLKWGQTEYKGRLVVSFFLSTLGRGTRRSERESMENTTLSYIADGMLTYCLLVNRQLHEPAALRDGGIYFR